MSKNNGNKKKNNAGSDQYSEMYERQLERFKKMGGEDLSDDSEDLHFYTEEELQAIERAKHDAARQAYQDAYAKQYSKSRQQYDSQSNVRGVNGQKKPKQVKNSSQRYAKAAREKHKSDNLEFGSKNSYTNSPKGKKAMKGGSAVGKFFKGLFLIILVIVILSQLLIFRYISMVNSVDTGDRLVTNASLQSSDVTNVLLIGSDTRDEDSAGRTDSMIMVSINKNTKEFTMTSFMRDSYVEIPNNGWAKLNAAYAYGGAELLMDTIELNFDVKIDRYVYVSFFSFVDIVDALGGIEIEISDEEAAGMTDPLAEQNKYLGNEKGTDYLTEGGTLTLNGNQTLAYARLRYVGNADFERTERQREVISKIIEKAKTLSPLALDNFIKVTASELTTNMSKAEMYIMFYKLLFSLGYESEQVRIPQDGAYSYGSHNGQSTLDLDFDACKEEIREKVFN